MTADNYAGTGMPLSDLLDLPRHERNALLAFALHGITERLKPLQEMRKLIEEQFRSDAWNNRRADGKPASTIDAGEFNVKINQEREWEYDAEGLKQLLGFVTQDEYEQAVKPTVKVNKTELNRLAERGGPIASIIDQNSRPHVKLHVEVVRKKTVVKPDPPRVFAPDDGVDHAA